MPRQIEARTGPMRKACKPRYDAFCLVFKCRHLRMTRPLSQRPPPKPRARTRMQSDAAACVLVLPTRRSGRRKPQNAIQTTDPQPTVPRIINERARAHDDQNENTPRRNAETEDKRMRRPKQRRPKLVRSKHTAHMRNLVRRPRPGPPPPISENTFTLARAQHIAKQTPAHNWRGSLRQKGAAPEEIPTTRGSPAGQGR